MRRGNDRRSRVARAAARVLPALLAVAALCAPAASNAAASIGAPGAMPGAHAAFAKLPLAFEVNRGQAAAPVRFLARGPGYGVLLTPGGAVLALQRDAEPAAFTHADVIDPSRPAPAAAGSDVVRLRFDGTNPEPLVTGHAPLRGRVNYLLGRDPSRWTTGVPTYARVRYHSIYPGIDAVFRGSAGRLEYDLVVAPGADLSQIRLAFEGVEGLAVGDGDALILHTPGGSLRQPKPTIFQERDGERRPVDGGFVLLDERTVGFAVGDYDATRPLVIDPVLVYSTWLGGSRSDEGLSVASDEQGHVYVAGTTSSADFPLGMPLQSHRLGDTDAFVAKLSPDGGELLFSTYIGGKSRDEAKKGKSKKSMKSKKSKKSKDDDDGDEDDEQGRGGGHICHDHECDRGADRATGIAVDAAGSVYLSGVTGSVSDFPVVGAVQPAYGGGDSDGFVLKLSPDGGFLDFSTYLGGRDSDEALDLALDAFGEPVIVGGTESDDFPVAGAVQPFRAGKRDAFVTRLAADGSFIDFSTYFGGKKDDEARAVAVGPLGGIHFAGHTRSKKDFPLARAFQPKFGGGKRDAFVAKLAADGASVDFATFLGGKGDDAASGLAIDSGGRAWVAGATGSKKDFPLERPVQSRYGGSSSDAFVTGLSPDGESLAFSSYLGGEKADRATAIALDGAGYLYVTGYTRSRRDFPLADPVQPSFGGPGPGGHGQPRDVFVTALAPLGAEIVYSTYLGGSGLDVGTDIASDVAGNVAITGYTRSTRDFPLVDALQPAFGGGHDDAFVAVIETTNLPPVITSTPGTFAQRGAPYVYDVEASDPNGDLLRFTLLASPLGMTIDPATGEIAWVADVSGDFDVTVEVDDFRAGTDTQSYVLGVNAPPRIVSVPPGPVLQGREFAYDVVAEDDDGDTLDYALSVAPAGMTIDPATGAVRWVPLVPGDYDVAVRVEDGRGGSDGQNFVVTVDADLVAPDITVDSPPDGLVTNEPSLVLSGSVDEPASVDVNGTPLPLDGNLGFGVALTLAEGPNTLVVTATDPFGNTATNTITVTLDTIAPAITVTAPPDGTTVTAPAQTIVGAVDEPATLTINGQPVAVAPDGSFAHPVTLAAGANVFALAAVDDAGNPGSTSLTVTLQAGDVTPPVISEVQPPDGTVLNGPAQFVFGLIDEPATVTVNGLPATVLPGVPDGFVFFAPVTLLPGPNPISIVATDLAGNSSQAELTLILADVDLVPPIISIASPADGSTTNDPDLTITGRVDETATVTVAGVPVALNPDLTFSTTVVLAEGTNPIVVQATDTAGNPAATTIDVALDTSPPDITLTSPIDGAVTNQPALTVTGNLGESASLALNGQPVAVLPDLTFAEGVTLSEGPNAFSLGATETLDAGIASGTESLANTLGAGAQVAPAIARLAGGGHVVVWRTADPASGDSDGGIAARRYDALGAPLGAELLVNSTLAGSQGAPDVVGLADGGFLVVWEGPGAATQAGQTHVFARRFDAGGLPAGAETQISVTDEDHGAASAARLATGETLLAWRAADTSSIPVYSILARRLDASGAPLGTELTLNAGTVAPDAAPRVAPLAGGGFAAAWEGVDGGGDPIVTARRFDGAGTPLGAEIAVNALAVSSPTRAGVAALPDGGFVVVWQSTSPGPGTSIAGQRFDASGAGAGTDLAISPAAGESHVRPAVTGLASGGFVVAWETDGPIGTDTDGGIAVRRFDRNGGALEDESAANALTFGTQARPALAGFDDGTVVAAWESADPASGDATPPGVAVRRIGTPPIVNESSLGFGVTLDTVPPGITVTEPADASTVFVPSVAVRGSLSESATLTLDGAPVTVLPDLSFDTTATLLPGANTLDLAATDSAGNTETASVTVTLDATPAFTSSPILAGTVGQQYAYDADASDPGANLLTFSLLQRPPGMTIGAVTGLVTWVPPAKGAADVTVRAANALGGVANQGFTITVPNRPPIITSTPPATTRLNGTFTYAATAQDPDADPLAFSLDVSPAGMTIDLATGRVDWTVNVAGPVDVTVRVDDGDGGAATQSFILAVDPPNQAPVIDTTPPTTGAVDTPYQYDANATDADGDALVFALTVAPVGMSIDPATGLVAWTPRVAGTFPVTVSVDDGHGGSAVQAFDITVTFSPGAQPPGLAPIGDQIVPLGMTTTIQLSASDPDGGTPRFLATPLPLAKNMKLNATSGKFTFTPALSQVGDHVLTFTASDGRFTDSETVTLTVPAPSGPTRLTGRVITTGGAPLAGVTLEIDGITVFSDANGDYFFPDLGTAAGDVRLLIDGASVDPALGTFATVPEIIPIVAGADNRLEPAIVLLPLDVASADPVVPSQTSIITSSRPTEGLEIFEPVTLTIPPGHAQLTDGTPFSGDIHISRVADPTQGPRPLPPDIDLSYYIAIQPFGVVYPVPVPISFPNVEHLPPESILDFFALNHDTGKMEKIGEGRVSLDGKTVDSIGGVVKSNSWHGIVPQAPVNSPHADDDQGNIPPKDDDKCPACRFNLQSGNLGEDHKLPAYYSLGAERRVHLSYNSLNANPRPIININSQFGNFAPPPLSMSLKLDIDGIDQGFEQFMETNVTPSTVRGQFEAVRPAVQYDAGLLATGIHEYALEVNCHFPISRRSETLAGTTVIQNERLSPFGAGWTLAGLHRLHLQTDGRVLMTQGDGTAIIFAPDPADPSGDSYLSPAGDFSVLARQPDGTSTRRMKDGVVYTFDAAGFQISDADRNGNTTTYVYDGQERLIRIVDPVGRSFVFTYFGDRIASVSDPLNRITRFVHDSEGNLVRIVEPNGDARNFEYDPGTHLLTAQRDQRENRTEYSYDFAGRIAGALLPDGSNPLLTPGVTDGLLDPTSGAGTGKDNLAGKPSLVDEVENVFTDENGNVERTRVDDLSAPVEHTDAVGRVTLDERDANSLPTGTTRPNQSRITREFDALGNPTLVREEFNGAEYRYEYDSNSLVTSATNPRNHTTTITRDADGNATAIVNHLGHTTAYEYNGRGLVTRSVSPNGLESVMTYNQLGLVATMVETPPPGSPGSLRSTSYRYDDAGQLTELVSPDGVVTTFGYDAKGRVTRITDNLGQAGAFAYDGFNNLVQSEKQNADGSIALRVARAFDVRNRLVETRAPHVGTEESVRQRVLDDNSNLTGLVDPNGNPSSNRFDAEDRLFESTHRENGVTTYTYDTNDRITGILAPNGVSTTYTYDVLGRRLRETDPDRGTLTYTYDVATNLTSITDGRGVTAAFTYDELERPLTKTFPNTIPGKIEDVVYTYDSCPFGTGRLCGRSDESGDHTYEYDAFGNRTRTTFIEVAGVAYVTEYEYDDGDSVIRTTYPTGRVVDLTRDAVRRIEAIDATVDGAPRSIVFGIEYRADGWPTQCTFGNGLTDSRTYDLQGRLVHQLLETPATDVVDERSYVYDRNGNVLSIDTSVEDNQYGYDRRDRLVSDRIDADSPREFTYDGNDNRETHDAQDLSLVSDYLYTPASNRLIRLGRFRTGAPQSAPPVRDLVYNDAGRLFEVYEDGLLVVRLVYNDEGQRTRKTSFGPDGTEAATTVFHYDLSGYLVSETTAQGDPMRDYLWLEGMVPVAQIDASGGFDVVTYLHTDHLMTNRLATDNPGQVVWRWEGEAFGNTPAQELGGVTINLRFPGQYLDIETNLHYNNFRYYDPEIGRYITTDPIGLSGGSNSYGYVGANPVTRYDAGGMFWVTVHAGVTREGARKAGMSPQEARELGKLTADVDSRPGSQLPENSHWHAMRDPEWDEGTARRKFNEWVNSNLQECKLENLAAALHAIQDSYSPTHMGFQPWHGVEDTGLWDLIVHASADSGASVPKVARRHTQNVIKSWLDRCEDECDR